jgi:hypothetical protein
VTLLVMYVFFSSVNERATCYSFSSAAFVCAKLRERRHETLVQTSPSDD